MNLTSDQLKDAIFDFYKSNHKQGVRIDWKIEDFLKTIGLDYHGTQYSQIEKELVKEKIIDKTGNGIIFNTISRDMAINGQTYLQYKDSGVSAQEQRIRDLTEAGLRHQETIRNQEGRIRDLTEEALWYNLVRRYWYILVAIIIGSTAVEEVTEWGEVLWKWLFQ